MDNEPGSLEDLMRENSLLQQQLEDSEETLRAIREGEIDALVVSIEGTEMVYTLEGADKVYRILIETMNEGAVTVSEDGTILFANNLFSQILDRPLDEVVGSSLLSYVKGDDSDRLTAVLESGYGNAKHTELELVRHDGRSVPVYTSVSRFDLDGQVGLCFVVTDLTQRKKEERERSAELEKLVDERTRELNEANQELDSYARTVSHDLRSPLTAVILSNEMLRDALEKGDPDSLRAEVEESVAVVGRSLGKAYALINDLLALAEAGAKPTRVEDVEVKEVVNRVLDEQANSIKSRKIQVMKVEDYGRIVANDTQVYQVFSNLISNAVHHNDNPEPVLMVLYLGESDGGRKYKVRDNSSGFPEEILDTIFELFQKKGLGTGIGLAIAKKIVNQYGGTIRAYNDDGACVEFTLRDFVA